MTITNNTINKNNENDTSFCNINTNNTNNTTNINTTKLISMCMEMEFELIEDKYNVILSFINNILNPPIKYISLTLVKNVQEKILKQLITNKDNLNEYIDEFESVGLKLNKKSKLINQPNYILNNTLKQIGYKLKKRTNMYNTIYYSIVKK
jgi:hypothetical protein